MIGNICLFDNLTWCNFVMQGYYCMRQRGALEVTCAYMVREVIGIIRKEGLSIPVRALVLIIDNLVLAPTLEFHSD